ncbi:hypothetical protein [Blastococcus sp. SYSU D00695]
MDPSSPMTLAAAGYGSLARAVSDYDAVWRARAEGPFHHSCLALVLHDRLGSSRVERSDNTAGQLVWGDGVLAAALTVLLPRLGCFPPVVGDHTGQDAFVGHFRRTIAVEDLVAAALLLDDHAIALVVVVLNRGPGDVLPLLSHARDTHAAATCWADLEDALGRDLENAAAARVLAPA